MFYTYILKSSKSPKLYYGYTTNLRRRFKEHNEGKSRFTKPFIPWKLVFYAAFEDEQRAKDFELYLKSGSGKAFAHKRFVAFSKDVRDKSSPKLQHRIYPHNRFDLPR